jgi:pimeloyl-ACP methyl ester carboxylesterase
MARYEGRLSAIQAPALVLHGREDRVIPLSTSQELLGLLPNVQLHIFGHCGHWTQTEHATEFNRIVRDFLTDGE